MLVANVYERSWRSMSRSGFIGQQSRPEPADGWGSRLLCGGLSASPPRTSISPSDAAPSRGKETPPVTPC